MQHGYEIDGVLFGIRSNSLEVSAWLDESLAAYRLPDDERVDPYYSIWLAEDEGVGRPFHILYEESRALLRSHDLGAIARTLLYELESIALRGRDDAVYLELATVGKNGLTALVPSLYVPYLRALGRRVEQELELPLTPTVAIDPDTGALIRAAQTLDIAQDAAERLAELAPTSSPAGSEPAPDRADLICFFQWTEDGTPVLPVPPALAVYNLARRCPNLHTLGAKAVEGLVRLVRAALCIQLQEAAPRDLLATLNQILVEPIGLVKADASS